MKHCHWVHVDLGRVALELPKRGGLMSREEVPPTTGTRAAEWTLWLGLISIYVNSIIPVH